MSLGVGVGAALVVGLLGGVHCVGMCGGIASVLAKPGPREQPWSRIIRTNAGRLGAYALQGAIVGAIGGSVASALPTAGAASALRVLAGVALLAVGLSLAGVRGPLGWVERRGAPLAASVRRLLGQKSSGVLGLAWGFVPCGLVYGALVLALASGSALAGAATMLAFGLGTLPAVVLIGALATRVGRQLARPRVRQTAGLLVALSGALQLAVLGVERGVIDLSPEQKPCCAAERDG